MLDEPTAGVDEPGQRHLNELVRHLQQDQGLTVLFISHELSIVYPMSKPASRVSWAATETLIGVVFSAALAIGSLMT
jgi:ABC-type glutathione transport system ATPase component